MSLKTVNQAYEKAKQLVNQIELRRDNGAPLSNMDQDRVCALIEQAQAIIERRRQDRGAAR